MPNESRGEADNDLPGHMPDGVTDGMAGEATGVVSSAVPGAWTRWGLLTQAEFHRLADVPPEAQWFANLSSAQTRRAYQSDIGSFMRFVGIQSPEEFRTVARGHVPAWRADLEMQGLAGAELQHPAQADHGAELDGPQFRPIRHSSNQIAGAMQQARPRPWHRVVCIQRWW